MTLFSSEITILASITEIKGKLYSQIFCTVHRRTVLKSFYFRPPTYRKNQERVEFNYMFHLVFSPPSFHMDFWLNRKSIENTEVNSLP